MGLTLNKNVPMKFKLGILCGIFLLIILLSNIYGNIQITKVSEQLNDISKVQLPAVRKMTLIDMYHDGLVGTAYKAVYLAELNNKAELDAVSLDVKESSQTMLTLYAEIDKIPLKAETKKAVANAKPAVETYIKNTLEVVSLASEGKKTEAIAKLPELDKAFGELEIQLGTLGDLIQKDSDDSNQRAIEVEQSAKNGSLIITIVSLVVGTAMSFYLISNLMTHISNSIEQISTNTHDLQNTSQVVSLISRRLSGTVDAQAASITESVTAMDEISAMIKNNDKSASIASELSNETKKSAESGKRTVVKMLDEMKEISLSYDEIQTSITKNKEDINKIVEVINQIAKKTEVINDIVFQTKLLSFNASVEAARAGESGKGFAVVAEEVGNLAQMSGKASQDIAEMLTASQEQVKNLAEQTTRSIEAIVVKGRVKVETGSEVAAECLNELEKIQQSAMNLDGSIEEISTAIKEQSIGVEEVNIALKQLDNGTNEATDMASKTKDASENLRVQAHSLRTVIQDLRKVLGAKKSYDAPPLTEEKV